MSTLTEEMLASIKHVEAEHGTPVVAIALDDDGAISDHCFTWETGQTMALSEGMRVMAVADDGHMDVESAQALYDHERALYRDCYGIEPLNDHKENT